MNPSFEQYLKSVEQELDSEEQRNRLKEVLATYKGDDELISSLEIEKRIREGDPMPVHATGISSLDTHLKGGFRPGQLIVVAAQTKHGKTQFCVFLTEKMVEQHPLWFSYEDSADEIVERFVDNGSPVPLFYTPSSLKQFDLNWMEQRIVESIVKFDTKLVFIDNLQCLVPRSQNQAAEYGFVTRKLKTLADKWKVAIVLVHHLLKVQLDRVPDLNDIKGSSDVAQDASTVILLWRQNGRSSDGINVTNNVLVDVAAVRRGKPGKFKMTFDGTSYYENNWSESVEAFNRDF
jgi:replicative DNA helicase